MALPGNRRHMANVLAGLGVLYKTKQEGIAQLQRYQATMSASQLATQRAVVDAGQAAYAAGQRGMETAPPTDPLPEDTLPDEQGEELLRPDPLPLPLPRPQATPAPSNQKWYALGAIAVLAAILLLRK